MVCPSSPKAPRPASIFPDGSVAVVPETKTVSPTSTARAYPTLGSQGVPENVLVRLTFMGVSCAEEGLSPPAEKVGARGAPLPTTFWPRKSDGACGPPGLSAGGALIKPRGSGVFLQRSEGPAAALSSAVRPRPAQRK